MFNFHELHPWHASWLMMTDNIQSCNASTTTWGLILFSSPFILWAIIIMFIQCCCSMVVSCRNINRNVFNNTILYNKFYTNKPISDLLHILTINIKMSATYDITVIKHLVHTHLWLHIPVNIQRRQISYIIIRTIAVYRNSWKSEGPILRRFCILQTLYRMKIMFCC